ncbi:MAG: hypothetical protein LBB08_01645 [Rickettsiales bacterium]|jgi:hypothetical protein|nr:hypothetical protein [Rickettsiales bacterium]
MKKIIELFLFFCASAFAVIPAVAAPNLSSEINMKISAASASTAKREATESATRSAVIQILSRYGDRAGIENIIAGADESVLNALIATTSISREKLSKTAYEARFAITLDRSAVEKWYADNNMPSSLPASEEVDLALVALELPNGLADWTDLKLLLLSDGDNYGLVVRSISGIGATAHIFTNKRRKFQNLVASAGWAVSNAGGFLKISR